jgi:predicted nucleic acid-binding protein
MPDNCFADSNVLVYTLDKTSSKRAIAFSIWREGVTVSTQVIMEFTNVCLRKLKMNKADAFENALNILDGATVRPVTKELVRESFVLSSKYGFSHWDSLIVAAALQANCTTLYSEDVQHGQIIEGKLTIVNPFSIS